MPERGAHGFGPERRIRRRADFVRVQSEGERTSTRHFVLLVAPRPLGGDARCARLGVVVTRKVGNAAQRNRVKRLCRECFRQWPGLVPEGIDLVVIARAGAPELDLARVRAEWEGARRALGERCRAALARAKSKGEETPARVRETGGGRPPEASSSARAGSPRRARAAELEPAAGRPVQGGGTARTQRKKPG